MPGKKHFQKSGLGRSLVKAKQEDTKKGNSRHTTVLNDGSDYGKLNLRSVTQENSLDEFITIAQLAGEEFTKDRDNITIITKTTVQGVLSEDEKRVLIKEQEENEDIITIPRRPPWNPNMSPEDLNKAENESFLEWRRKLAKFQEESKLVLTPFEKNFEFWRQLWRVVERSDVVVQILDARNPLLFLSKDLQKYVQEVDSNKMNLVILNKADLLTENQRIAWADYFEQMGIGAVFFSALEETTSSTLDETSDSAAGEEEAEAESSSEEGVDPNDLESEKSEQELEQKEQINEDEIDKSESKASSADGAAGNEESERSVEDQVESQDYRSKLLNREELIEYLQSVYPKDRDKVRDEYLTIGLVGYPNVGKSSTINSLLKCKKVSVSATPGKTKHFQTLFLHPELCLCDCPGLVFPNFVSSKAEMILNGILPIDQMTDHVPPINQLISLIPAYVFEVMYSITLPLEVIKSQRQLTAEQLLNAYGYMRGFMTQRGLPDNPRSARYILKDFVNGKVVYCLAPPGVEQKEYHQFINYHRPRPGHITNKQEFLFNFNTASVKNFDSNYFSTSSTSVHAKGPLNVINFARANTSSNTISTNGSLNAINKPWRLNSKRNTKQKLRKAFAHLDTK